MPCRDEDAARSAIGCDCGDDHDDANDAAAYAARCACNHGSDERNEAAYIEMRHRAIARAVLIALIAIAAMVGALVLR